MILPLTSFAPATHTSTDSVASLYNDAVTTARTFVNEEGDAELSISVNGEGKISGVSTFGKDLAGNVIFVDSKKMILPLTSFAPATHTSTDSVASLYNDAVTTARTFVNEEGDAELSISVNGEGKISGVSTFGKDLAGNVIFVDSKKMILPLTSFAPATHTSTDSVASLYNDAVTTARTFVNEEGDAELSISGKGEGKISGVSTFGKDLAGNVIFVDSKKMILPLTSFAPATHTSTDSVASLYNDAVTTARTFVNEEGDAELSISVNGEGKISGVSTFGKDQAGNVIFVDSKKMILPLSDFAPATHTSTASVASLYNDAVTTARTFVNEEGDAELSISVNGEGKISGVSTFGKDQAGNVIFVDSKKMILPLTSFAPATHTSTDSVASLYNDAVTTARTFVNEEGDAELSISVNGEGKISGVSTFGKDLAGNVIFVDSKKMILP